MATHTPFKPLHDRAAESLAQSGHSLSSGEYDVTRQGRTHTGPWTGPPITGIARMSHSAFGHNWVIGFEPGAFSLTLPRGLTGEEARAIAMTYIDMINLRRTGE